VWSVPQLSFMLLDKFTWRCMYVSEVLSDMDR
jgi:hypothetical protein